MLKTSKSGIMLVLTATRTHTGTFGERITSLPGEANIRTSNPGRSSERNYHAPNLSSPRVGGSSEPVSPKTGPGGHRCGRRDRAVAGRADRDPGRRGGRAEEGP